MREKVVPSRYGANVSRWVSIFDVFDRARRPTDPPRNPHERRNSETGPHVGIMRVGEGNRRPSHACRVRVWRLRAVSMGGSEKKTTISGRKRLIDFFNSRSVHDTIHSSAFQRETSSARTLVMPRRNPTLPVRTHGQTQRHARPSEETTGRSSTVSSPGD